MLGYGRKHDGNSGAGIVSTADRGYVHGERVYSVVVGQLHGKPKRPGLRQTGDGGI